VAQFVGAHYVDIAKNITYLPREILHGAVKNCMHD
jgi:hypothetical protein